MYFRENGGGGCPHGKPLTLGVLDIVESDVVLCYDYIVYFL